MKWKCALFNSLPRCRIKDRMEGRDRAGIKITATLIPSYKTTGLTNTNCIHDISTFCFIQYIIKKLNKNQAREVEKNFHRGITNCEPIFKDTLIEINLRIKKEKRKESILETNSSTFNSTRHELVFIKSRKY